MNDVEGLEDVPGVVDSYSVPAISLGSLAHGRDILRRALFDAERGNPEQWYAAVYHFTDAEHRSIYAGSSGDLQRRFAQHSAISTWVQFACFGEIVWHPSIGSARLAETALIEGRRPFFNVRDNDEGARQRLVRYLIEVERPDLLVPAIRLG